MKFETRTDDLGRFEISANPSDYDGHPRMPRLLMDVSPQSLHPDRLAAACIMVFRRYCAGDIVFPQPVSPAMAEAVRVYARGRNLHISPIEYYPKPLPIGQSNIIVSNSSNLNAHGEIGDGTRFFVLPMDRYFGASASRLTWSIPSNSALISQINQECAHGCDVSSLAIAVIFAEDMDADEVSPVLCEKCANEISALLSSCRLGLTPQ